MPIRSAKAITVPSIRVECFMACDYAHYEHGKFVIAGGGWDQLSPPMLPHAYNFYIAIKLSIPKNESPESIELAIRFTTERGEIPGGAEPLTIEFSGDPSLPTNRISVPLAIRVETTLVESGEYGIQLLADRTVIAETSFRVDLPLQLAPDARDSNS